MFPGDVIAALFCVASLTGVSAALRSSWLERERNNAPRGRSPLGDIVVRFHIDAEAFRKCADLAHRKLLEGMKVPSRILFGRPRNRD